MLLIILVILFAIVSGYKEGMIMIKFRDPNHNPEFKEGVRGHDWFKYYHWGDRFIYPLFATLSILVYNNPPGLYVSLGLLVLLWELRECGYNLARYRKVFAASENVMGVGFNIRGSEVIVLHVVRVTIAGMFLYGGMV